MKNLIKTNSEIEENQKNEINQVKDPIKISNHIQEEVYNIEKSKDKYNQSNKINFLSNNSNDKNILFKSNNSQTSFPLLFK